MFALLAAVAFCIAQDGRTAVPDATKAKAVEKEIRSQYKLEYASQNIADRIRLAATLLTKAGEETDDVKKYVMLRESGTLATQCGDAAGAVRAVDAMAATFEVDGMAMKSKVLGQVPSGLQPPDPALVARLYLALSKDAEAAGRYDVAGTAAAMAGAHAKRTKNAWMQGRAESRGRDVADFKKQVEKVKHARKTLETAPENPEANLEVGRWLCFFQGEWEQGFEHFGKSGDAALARLLKKEAQSDGSKDARIELGDLWWERSMSETGRARVGARERAVAMYADGFLSLDRGDRRRIEPRITEHRSERGGGYEDVSDPAYFGRSDVPFRLTPSGQPDSMTLDRQKWPIGQFDAIQVRFRLGPAKKDSGLTIALENGKFMAGIQDKAVISWRREEDSGPFQQDTRGGAVSEKDEYVMELSLQEGKYIVTVDGAEQLRTEAKHTAIEELRFQVNASWTEIYEVKLRYKK